MSDDGGQLELPLPGFDEPRQGASALELAVRRTFAAIADDGGELGEADAGRLQLAVELAQIIDIKKSTKRTSTVSNDARLLVELLNQITGADQGADGDTDRRLRAAMDAWSEQLEREGRQAQ